MPKNSEVLLPYRQVMVLLRSAHTRYILPTLLIPIFRFFLKSKNLKSLMVSPKSHSTVTLKNICQQCPVYALWTPLNTLIHLSGLNQTSGTRYKGSLDSWNCNFRTKSKILRHWCFHCCTKKEASFSCHWRMTFSHTAYFNASINSSGAHPPPGNHGAFAQMSVPGVGH